MMFERFTKKSVLAGGTALLTMFGVGGAALAQSNTVTAKAPSSAPAAKQAPGQENAGPENSATDTDNVQQGDQTGTEKADGPESATEKADGPESATDAPDAGANQVDQK
jgi:hypothetical protein